MISQLLNDIIERGIKKYTHVNQKLVFLMLLFWKSLWVCECVTLRNDQRTNPVWCYENFNNNQLIMKNLPITRNHGNRQDDGKRLDMNSKRNEGKSWSLKKEKKRNESDRPRWKASERCSSVWCVSCVRVICAHSVCRSAAAHPHTH